MEIQEVDSEGQLRAVFEYDSKNNAIQKHDPAAAVSTNTSLLVRLVDVFLPAGYPSTVTPDYTPYQIYDTLQAFASTIAGLLSSRAVFIGMGVGSEEASVATTMLLYIAQETIGRIATILFAHQFSQQIEAEVKFYRFFADIVNDIAFVLDCLSPGLPVLARVCTLCASNACRAVCGVSGGSSKAILSSHFAKAGNIGELNAKDGSQETVVSLVGMWLGGLVVSKVHGTFHTWCFLIPLLVLHLWANWWAVCSIRLSSLNQERGTILFSALLRGQLKDVDQVGQEESIFGVSKLYLSQTRALQVGVSISDFLDALSNETGNDRERFSHFNQLLEIFHDEQYVLWVDLLGKRGVVLLKESATAETQAKCLCHFLRIRMQIADSADFLQQQSDHGSCSKQRDLGPDRRAPPGINKNNQSTGLMSVTLGSNQQEWNNIRGQLERAGWVISLTNLVGGRCPRFRTIDKRLYSKKDQ